MAERKNRREPLVTMKMVKIYIEGGGDQNRLKSECRRAFSKFFEKAGLKGCMPSVVACGSRQNAYDDFCIAVKKAGKNEIPFLLVDFEGKVSKINKQHPWEHLESSDNWEQPEQTSDQQAHLMVQMMEAWFMADKNNLNEFYGKGFNENALPKQVNIEAIPKDALISGLEKASEKTIKGKYGKGAHSFKILEKIGRQGTK